VVCVCVWGGGGVSSATDLLLLLGVMSCVECCWEVCWTDSTEWLPGVPQVGPLATAAAAISCCPATAAATAARGVL